MNCSLSSQTFLFVQYFGLFRTKFPLSQNKITKKSLHYTNNKQWNWMRLLFHKLTAVLFRYHCLKWLREKKKQLKMVDRDWLSVCMIACVNVNNRLLWDGQTKVNRAFGCIVFECGLIISSIITMVGELNWQPSFWK